MAAMVIGDVNDSNRMITKAKSCRHEFCWIDAWFGAKTEWKWRQKINVGAEKWEVRKEKVWPLM